MHNSAGSDAPDSGLALLMLPLIERGRDALRTYIATLPPDAQPLGGPRSVGSSIDVVTHADFVANPALCLRYVVQNSAPTHVLCEDGALCALIAKRTSTW